MCNIRMFYIFSQKPTICFGLAYAAGLVKTWILNLEYRGRRICQIDLYAVINRYIWNSKVILPLIVPYIAEC